MSALVAEEVLSLALEDLDSTEPPEAVRAYVTGVLLFFAAQDMNDAEKITKAERLLREFPRHTLGADPYKMKQELDFFAVMLWDEAKGETA